MNKISREQIDEIFEKNILHTLMDVQNQYVSILDGLSEEEKKNPLVREMTAIYLSQSNIMAVIKDIIYELCAM